jgi:hypothetical protein
MRQMILKVPRHNSDNDKIIFEAWFTAGSIKRAAQKLAKDGIVSARGKPYSAPGVHKAAKRYMVDNYAEAKQILLDTYKKNGYIVEDKFIERYMIKMAVETLVIQERVKFWLVENNLLEKHKDYIGSLIYIPDD